MVLALCDVNDAAIDIVSSSSLVTRRVGFCPPISFFFL